MQTFYTVTLLLFILIPAKAQTSKIDSLEAVLRQVPADTNKIAVYLELFQAHKSLDTAQSVQYLNSAIRLGEATENPNWLGRAYLEVSGNLWPKGRLVEAKSVIAKLDSLLPRMNDKRLVATVLMEKGVVHLFSGDHQQAIDYLFEALNQYEEINDSLGSSLSYTYIGNAHVSLGYPDQAKEYYESALKMARLVNYTKGQANALGNMGRVYRASQEYEQSLYYYRQSLAMNQELDFPEDERIDLHNIGTIYFKLKKLDSARLFFDQAKKLAREINSQRGILLANHATAVLEARRGNYAQANKLLDQSLELAQQLAMKQSVKNIYRSYSYNYEDLGEYKKALEYRIKYEKLHDSLINENHLNRITELGVQYQTAKKNEKIALLSKQKELNEARLEQQSTQNQALWGGLLLIITITVLVVYLLRQRLINQRLMSAKNEEIKTAQFKQQLSELEMKALRAQMNPHFMFNCLNSINRMVLSGDNRNAARYLTKFGKLIRLMLENSEHPTVSLADELTMLESYLELERLRFKEKISYHIRVDDRIDRETTLLPSMVLQPFIENAILHGLMHKNTPGLVEISISQNKLGLKCTIQDDGVGREQSLVLQESQASKKKSMGMQITEQRLKIFTKNKLRDLVSITDLKDSMNRALGTRVDVLIPTT